MRDDDNRNRDPTVAIRASDNAISAGLQLYRPGIFSYAAHIVVDDLVELNQAQLNEISAEIEYANTKYEYLLRLSALNFQTGSLR